MKNKSALMILLKLTIVLLVIALFIIVLFLYNALIGKKYNKKEIKYNSIIKKYNIKGIDTIYFDFKNYEVKYLTKNIDKLIIKQNGKASKLYIDKEKNNNKLFINESVSNIFDKKKFIIYIPKDYDGKINIENGFSNISIIGLNDIELNNNSGNVKIKDVKLLNVKNVSGNIYINGHLNLISGSSSTGNISIDKLKGSCNIETITGDIKINNYLITDESSIETTSGDIILRIDKKSNCSLKYDKNKSFNISKKKCNKGNIQLKLKNVTGNITIW